MDKMPGRKIYDRIEERAILRGFRDVTELGNQ
jgi:hypothetical protein